MDISIFVLGYVGSLFDCNCLRKAQKLKIRNSENVKNNILNNLIMPIQILFWYNKRK